MLELADLEHRLDDLTAPLLVPLRSDKIVDGVVMADLLALGDKLADELRGMDQVPRSLVGKSYFIFTQMLTESEHASAPEPILDAAWQWQERLRRAFGPNFE